MRTRVMKLCWLTALCLTLAGATASAETLRLRGETMGTTWQVSVAAAPSAAADPLKPRIEALLERINNLMSTYRPQSELSRLNANSSRDWLPVSQELFTVLSAAIVRQSLQLRISSTHDALTKVMNRAFFEERLADELVRGRRTGQPLCVALLDIDHFKRVNDTYGHLAGDEVLSEVARRLTAGVRGPDAVGRWGGEEFLMLLPEADEAEAVAAAERLRTQVQAPVSRQSHQRPPSQRS